MQYQNTNTQLIELVVFGIASPGNQESRIQFPNLPFLDGKFIRSLEVYTVNDMAKSPTNNDLIDSATLKKAYLTLYIINPKANNGQGGEYMQRIPLASLHSLSNGTDPFEQNMFLMSGQIISWDKCFINLASPIANTTNKSFLINVGYDWNNDYKAN